MTIGKSACPGNNKQFFKFSNSSPYFFKWHDTRKLQCVFNLLVFNLRKMFIYLYISTYIIKAHEVDSKKYIYIKGNFLYSFEKYQHSLSILWSENWNKKWSSLKLFRVQQLLVIIRLAENIKYISVLDIIDIGFIDTIGFLTFSGGID